MVPFCQKGEGGRGVVGARKLRWPHSAELLVGFRVSMSVINMREKIGYVPTRAPLPPFAFPKTVTTCLVLCTCVCVCERVCDM